MLVPPPLKNCVATPLLMSMELWHDGSKHQGREYPQGDAYLLSNGSFKAWVGNLFPLTDRCDSHNPLAGYRQGGTSGFPYRV